MTNVIWFLLYMVLTVVRVVKIHRTVVTRGPGSCCAKDAEFECVRTHNLETEPCDCTGMGICLLIYMFKIVRIVSFM